MNETLGSTIRQARTSSKISLRKMASELSISAPFLSDIELSRRNPSPALLAKIAVYTHFPLQELQALDNRVLINFWTSLIASNPAFASQARRVAISIGTNQEAVDALISLLSQF